MMVSAAPSTVNGRFAKVAVATSIVRAMGRAIAPPWATLHCMDVSDSTLRPSAAVPPKLGLTVHASAPSIMLLPTTVTHVRPVLGAFVLTRLLTEGVHGALPAPLMQLRAKRVISVTPKHDSEDILQGGDRHRWLEACPIV